MPLMYFSPDPICDQKWNYMDPCSTVVTFFPETPPPFFIKHLLPQKKVNKIGVKFAELGKINDTSFILNNPQTSNLALMSCQGCIFSA